HGVLDAAIDALHQSPAPCLLRLQRLKKLKLQLRDRIVFIEVQITPDIIGWSLHLPRAANSVRQTVRLRRPFSPSTTQPSPCERSRRATDQKNRLPVGRGGLTSLEQKKNISPCRQPRESRHVRHIIHVRHSAPVRQQP